MEIIWSFALVESVKLCFLRDHGVGQVTNYVAPWQNSALTNWTARQADMRRFVIPVFLLVTD